MVAAAFVPFLSAAVRHYHLGLLTARTPELQREPLGELGAAPFDAMDASPTKDGRSAFPPEHISSGPVAASATTDGKIWGMVMLYAWITATIALLARLAVTFLYGRHLVCRARRVACEPMQKAADAAASKVGLPRGLQARASDRIRSPVVWCWTRPPILLVPSDCQDGRTDWAGVVAHELAHCKRWDHLTGLLAELAVSLLPWNPLMWLSKRQLIRLGEEACDDWVVATGHPSEDYAESLIRFRPQRQMAFVPGVVHSRTGVAARVRRILNDACGNPRTGTKWALGMTVLVVCVAVGLAFAQTRPAKPNATTTHPEEPTPESVNKAAANSEKPEQPRYPARTFNSDVAFKVFVAETSGDVPMPIGYTPAAVPLEIPACWFWQVQPLAPVTDWDLLSREIGRNEVPGLIVLDSATDSDVRHLADLTGLQSLDFRNTQITDAGLFYLKDLTGLHELRLYDAPITGPGLEHLKGLTGLRSLWLFNTQTTDVGLEHLKDLTGLEGLNLGGTRITDAGLEHLKGLTGLRGLILSDTRITDAGLAHLKGLTGLKTLHLERTQVTDAGLAHLSSLAELEGLNLEGTRITGTGLEHLKDLAMLRWLFLNDTQITDAGLSHLKGPTGLADLRLDGTQITDTGLAHLKGLTGLWQLDLDRTRITGTGLEHLEGLTGLRSLSLSGSQTTDAGLEHVRGLTGLTDLCLDGTQITDTGLAHLKGLSGLALLTLSNTRITDAGMEYLKGLTGLTVLVLSNTRITDAGLEHLKGLTGLNILHLEKTQITDGGLAHLKGLAGLQALQVGETQITDAGLEHLKGLTGLHGLQLERTSVTDAGLTHLKGLTRLEWLNLSGTQVTDAGLQQLEHSLPMVTIERGQAN
jgi:beta-lactamase regulating signal transducer with metallopeptidase domain/Leucine-rich repeat (LRR) protein